MTRNEIVELIRDRLGFNTGLNVDIIYRHLNYVQDIYETGRDKQPLPWFLFDVDATVSTVATQRYVNLPAEFISFDEDFPLSITFGGLTYPLDREDYHVLIADTDLTSARPTHYDMVGNQLLLFPVPDQIYTITIPHYARGTALGSTDTSPWFSEFPTLLVEEVTNSIMRATRDLEGLQMSNVNLLRDDYFRRVEARRHTLKSYKTGEL